jgi:hypothetical protein
MSWALQQPAPWQQYVHQPCISIAASYATNAELMRVNQQGKHNQLVTGHIGCMVWSQVPLKRGEHRAYMAVHDGGRGTSVISITLDKGARTRGGEDQVVSTLLTQVIPAACWCCRPLTCC